MMKRVIVGRECSGDRGPRGPRLVKRKLGSFAADECMPSGTLWLRKMSMNPSSMRYHGKSSSLLFIQTAMDLKQEYAGIELPKTIDPEAHNTLLRRRQQYWSLHPVR